MILQDTLKEGCIVVGITFRRFTINNLVFALSVMVEVPKLRVDGSACYRNSAP